MNPEEMAITLTPEQESVFTAIWHDGLSVDVETLALTDPETGEVLSPGGKRFKIVPSTLFGNKYFGTIPEGRKRTCNHEMFDRLTVRLWVSQLKRA